MSSRFTLLLAGILLVGALVAGYWGVRLSRQSEPAPLQPQLEPPALADVTQIPERVEARLKEERRNSVVVLARDLKPLVPIVAEDLAVEHLRIAPPGSFARVEELLGRTLWRELPAGSMLNAASFEMGGPLARMIRPQERALAIAVDDVVGGGGHLAPGDYVDVMLYLRESEKNRDQTAQVVIPALRVLSFGEALGATNTGEPAVRAEHEEDKEQRVTRRKEPARTAVLAVPEQLLSRFLLASQVGVLRLAVRSADEHLLADYYAGAPLASDVEELKRQLFQFEKLALRQARQPQSGLVRPRAMAVQVYRGTDVSRQTP
ncbi:Flp pilus assembly protein CpaB [Pseudomonas sp. BAY1663]|uniref:Flp pilus assembly protein CpaB n=1 Tax=Pseudomonas sp. BAY1663 TaxID=1439940 RepID=UPI00042DF785|nr:Flp pilus assembly protein CpaB [Pseudomonas sp. BAY1663]EXF45582.1 Flp pilus assembly protein CpaB [Pseudomonas sp. BAY1663]